MKRLGKIELEKRKMAMRVRAALRLRAAEMYLEELNEVLPTAEIQFDKKVMQGQLPAPIDIKKIIGA